MAEDADKIDTALHMALTASHVKTRGMEMAISRLLSFGVILSTTVVVTGGAMLLAQHGAEMIDLRDFHGEPVELSSLEQIWQAALLLKPLAIVQLGLLLLVATPIARVALSVLLFWKKGDYLYVGITLVVLVILFLAIALGH